jgi:hypothetical protein
MPSSPAPLPRTGRGAGDERTLGYSLGVTDQPVSPPFLPGIADHEAAAPEPARRLPGEPHPYMLQRNPPNLWILVALTVFSLALAFLILGLTVVL